MVIPKINSAHGSDTRNIINRAIELINLQGKSIQDLVAEGQLTPTQYATLIQTVNGLISKGNVTFDDIDKRGRLLDSTFFTSEFLKQLNDGVINSTNVLPDSISAIELQTDSVTSDKLDFVSKTRNLFDASRMAINKALTSDGSLVNSAGIGTTDYFIEVYPNTSYYKNDVGSMMEYDIDKIPVKYRAFDFTEGVTITTENTRFVKLSVSLSSANQLQFEKGSVGTSYTPYNRFINKSMIVVSGEQVEPQSVPLSKLSGFETGKNLFNKRNLIVGYVNRLNGEFVSNPAYRVTDYIEYQELMSFTLSPRINDLSIMDVVFYDKNLKFISGIRFNKDSTNYSFIPPEGSNFMRVSVPANIVELTQLEKGEVSTPYENYYNYHPDIIDPTANNIAPIVPGESSKKNYLEVTNPHEVIFKLALSDSKRASFKYGKGEVGDDFMKGRESGIYSVDESGNELLLYNLTAGSSNKEFALLVNDTVGNSDWFPEHNGVPTAFLGEKGFIQLIADGKEISLNRVSGKIPFNEVELIQKIECKLPTDNSPRAIITFISIIKDGKNENEVRIEWLKKSEVVNGYIFMTPMDTPNFVDNLLTEDFQQFNSKVQATTQEHTSITNFNNSIFTFTSNRSGKTDIAFTTKLLKQSESVKELFWQHRGGLIEKLYPQQYKNTIKNPGDIDYFEGLYQIKFSPRANEIYTNN